MVKEIVARLKSERRNNKITLEELSRDSGVSVKHICNIENGKATPTMEVLEKLAGPLGLTIEVNVQPQNHAQAV